MGGFYQLQLVINYQESCQVFGKEWTIRPIFSGSIWLSSSGVAVSGLTLLVDIPVDVATDVGFCFLSALEKINKSVASASGIS